MIVLWILIIIAAYYIFKDRIHLDIRGNENSNAEEILKQRYVNGEINEETYLIMKKEISQ